MLRSLRGPEARQRPGTSYAHEGHRSGDLGIPSGAKRSIGVTQLSGWGTHSPRLSARRHTSRAHWAHRPIVCAATEPRWPRSPGASGASSLERSCRRRATHRVHWTHFPGLREGSAAHVVHGKKTPRDDGVFRTLGSKFYKQNQTRTDFESPCTSARRPCFRDSRSS